MEASEDVTGKGLDGAEDGAGRAVEVAEEDNKKENGGDGGTNDGKPTDACVCYTCVCYSLSL